MTNPVIIETDLRDVLIRLDNRLDRIDQNQSRIEEKLNDRLDRMEQTQSHVEEKLNDRLDRMEQNQSQIVEKLNDRLGRMDQNQSQIVEKLNNRLDRIEQKLEVLPRIETEITQLKMDVNDLKGRASAQIWALIGIIFTAVIGTIIKFEFFPNP